MPTNAAAVVIPLSPRVQAIVDMVYKEEDRLFEMQEEIKSMEQSLDYTEQRLADLACSKEALTTSAAEIADIRLRIKGMKSQLGARRGSATKLQKKINQLRDLGRSVMREEQDAKFKSATAPAAK
jgi:chromosome segregation ATPase